MFSSSENWARTPPAALQVEPEPSSSLSTTTTSRTPASARWKATDVPITPPPMTTTSAWLGSSAESEVKVRLDRERVQLRLLQLPRVVPVHGLPAGELIEHPHARLPGAVAALAVTAERQVRLGPGRRVVDAHHSGGNAGAEPEGLVRVRGVDRARQAVARLVAQLDRLVQVRVLHDADDRAERLLEEQLVVGTHTGNDCGVVEEAVRTSETVARAGI